jgi:hypothetical protein
MPPHPCFRWDVCASSFPMGCLRILVSDGTHGHPWRAMRSKGAAWTLGEPLRSL